MPNSFPRLTNIDTPVAEDWWECELVDRETRRTSRIAIGRPVPLPGDSNGDWYCPLSFDHYTLGVKCFMGVSPLDAFLRAVRFVMDRERELRWITPLAEAQSKQTLEASPPPEPLPGGTEWQPHVDKIDDPIVEDWWSYALPDGSKRASHILIGRPAPLASGSDWYCPLSFEHITPGVHCVYGVGPVDTLRNAADFILTRLDWFSFVSPRTCPPGERSKP